MVVEKVLVIPNHLTTWGRAWRLIGLILLWLVLCASVAAGRWLYGGSILLELMAAIITIVTFAAWVKRDNLRTGTSVTMTRGELATWVAEGCPADAEGWLRDRQDQAKAWPRAARRAP